MKNHIISTITLGLSVLFFLVASALTVAPLTSSPETSSDIEFYESIEIPDIELESHNCQSGCCTCTSTECEDATFCGTKGPCTDASPICEMTGGLCGPDCGNIGEN